MTKQTLAEISRQAVEFVQGQRSLVLATVDGNGLPLASYAPFYRDTAGNFFVFVSTLSPHTASLLDAKVSVMLIEDEKQCRQIYARKRIIFLCNSRQASENRESILEKLQQRHGEIIETLSSLQDFKLVCLQPQSGRLISGFGQAYDIDASLNEITPVTPSSSSGP